MLRRDHGEVVLLELFVLAEDLFAIVLLFFEFELELISLLLKIDGLFLKFFVFFLKNINFLVVGVRIHILWLCLLRNLIQIFKVLKSRTQNV